MNMRSIGFTLVMFFVILFTSMIVHEGYHIYVKSYYDIGINEVCFIGYKGIDDTNIITNLLYSATSWVTPNKNPPFYHDRVHEEFNALALQISYVLLFFTLLCVILTYKSKSKFYSYGSDIR